MRLVQISVSDDTRDAVLDVLRDNNLGYTITAGAGEQSDRSLVSFVLPADAVEHVLEDLRETGFEEDQFTVSLSAEFAEVEGLDSVQDHWANTSNKIAPRTLRSKAKDIRLNTRSYVWLMFLSTIVATAGLLLGSPAIIVGSMVIAPLVGPMLTASVGAVRNDRRMVVQSLHMQALGLGVAILGAVVVSMLVRGLQIVPPTLAIETLELVALRVSPGVLSAAVGLAAGAAGAFSIATKGRVSLVGVMIAAALIPTAATTGIALAWQNVLVTVGSLLLLVVTVVAVNVGAFAALLYLGYRPDEQNSDGSFVPESTKARVVVGTTLLLAAFISLVVLGGFTQQAVFEQQVNVAVSNTLDDGQYESLQSAGLTMEYTSPVFVQQEPVITVTISRTSDREFSELPSVLERAIREKTGRTVAVRVRFVDYEH
ncbi:TIGR00341 family protein [Halorientalis brevis]|uniref:TIGR00341 family protein n=1 Tax=Halorientalis brevis TaxID=1126241 RepID=A0ABD6CD22_9EURY|nr:TIGR00341 family protein [Halorientalis brevis]